MNSRVKNYNILVPCVCALLFFLGFELGGYQIALLKVAEEFSLSDGNMGSLVAMQYIGIVVAPLVFGRVADKVGKKRIILIFMGIFILGCMVIVNIPSTISFIIGIFILGCGYSVCESVGTAALSDLRPEAPERYMNLSQCFFSLGAVVSPIVCNYLIDAVGFSWRVVFWVCSGAYLILLVPVFLSRFRDPVKETQATSPEPRRKFSYLCLLTVPFLSLFFAMFLTSCIENGVPYFVDLFFVREFNSPDTSAKALSCFWLASIVARFGASFLSRQKYVLMTVCFGVCILAGGVLFLAGTIPLSVFCFIVLGIMTGPAFPMLMSMGTTLYQGNSGTVVSILMTASGAGGALAPALMGFLSDAAGVRAALLMSSVVAALALGAFIIHGKSTQYGKRKITV